MTLTVLSLGAGVQSTTVALMSAHGELPRIDCAVFADTGCEPAAVYQHLALLEHELAGAGIPVHRVATGNLGDDYLNSERPHANIPLYLRRTNGEDGMLRRQCTEKYKIRPMRRKIQELRDGQPVRQWFGISWDELHRMSDPDVKFVTHVYPLVDLRMSRLDCHRWLAAHGWTAPRSACVFCPYHSNREWRHIRDNDPEGWGRAVEFDRRVRHGASVRNGEALDGEAFVHAARVPLADVDLTTVEDHGQGSLFGSECEGMCGV